MTGPGRTPFRRKIAVLGGGIGALSAVFELTSNEDWRERFDITVYQLGWRLGGKGASGRFRSDTADVIEEHGLHIWPGFYHRSFELLRHCYAELGRAGFPMRWDDAFEPLSHVFMSEEVGGEYVPWRIQFPPRPGSPGDADGLDDPASLIRALADVIVDAVATDLRPRRRKAAAGTAARGREEAFFARLAAAFSPVREALDDLLSGRLVEAASLGLQTLLRTLREFRAEEPQNHVRRRTALMLDLGGTILRGLIADDVARRGFRHLDEEEWTAWLRRHGADEEVLESAIVRGCYDFAFAYEGGRADARAMAAGAGTRMLLRMLLTYKGAFFYKMKASMGEVVFTPLYLALKERGVRFRFFHRVTGISPDATGSLIDEIRMVRQADVAGGPEAYQPLCDGIGPIRAWPSSPDLDQLSPRGAIAQADLECFWTDWDGVERLRLRRGVDFDTVILGISIGAFPWICADLIRSKPEWRNMVEHVKTVPTQAMQLWVNAGHEALGARQSGSVVTAFTKPYDTWADMSHLIAVERWRDQSVTTVAYFCGVLEEAEPLADISDRTFPAREKARARSIAAQWRQRHLRVLWPGYDARAVAGTYVRANVNPSDRYVLTVPGSTKFRLAADKSGFSNLYLAGDWVENDLNGGCVESAVLAGLDAAKALYGDTRFGGRHRRRPPERTHGVSPFAAERSPLPWRLVFGTGQLEAAMMTIPVNVELLEAQLPERLRLLPQDLTPQGRHPVGIMFNAHRDVRLNIVPFGGISYPEYGIVVPFVGHAEGRREEHPMAYVADLRVGHLMAKAFGIPYGYGKRMAEFDYLGDSYQVAEGGRVLAEAGLLADGPVGTVQEFAHLAAARRMIEQPMVNLDPLGFLHYSYLEMHLDDAEYQPLAGSISLPDGVGPVAKHTIPSIGSSPLGAFRISTYWTLTQPAQSPFLGRVIKGRSG